MWARNLCALPGMHSTELISESFIKIIIKERIVMNIGMKREKNEEEEE